MRIILEDFRNRRNLTQAQLARRSGIPQPIISQIETEVVKNPGVKTLAALARALRCTVDDLIDETDGRENDGLRKSRTV